MSIILGQKSFLGKILEDCILIAPQMDFTILKHKRQVFLAEMVNISLSLQCLLSSFQVIAWQKLRLTK